MLRHPTLDQLHVLGLQGMAKAFADLADADEAKDLAHADWLALLLDRETSWRRDKRLTTRLRAAKLRQQASVEDVDYRAARGLDRALRAGSIHLNSFRVSISVVLPGLRCILPHRDGTEGGRSPTGGPTPMWRRKFHAATAKGRGVK